MFLPKYDNFKIISTDDICLSVYSIQGVKLNDERTKFRKLCSHTLKLRLPIILHEAKLFCYFQP